jgi:hypothetical protein
LLPAAALQNIWLTSQTDRGEAVNHGILDALRLLVQLRQVKKGEKSLENAVADYQKEVVERGREAVLLSRQACLDAHNPEGIPENSPLMRRSEWIEEGFIDTLRNDA